MLSSRSLGFAGRTTLPNIRAARAGVVTQAGFKRSMP